MSEEKKPANYKFANLMLVESVYVDGPAEPIKNFIGIPMNNECPFLEVIFDPIKKMLGIVSKYKKSQFHYVPKLGGNGAPLPNNDKKSNQNMPFQQERVTLDTYHEYYIRKPEEIDAFLKMYVANKFNWKSFQ